MGRLKYLTELPCEAKFPLCLCAALSLPLGPLHRCHCLVGLSQSLLSSAELGLAVWQSQPAGEVAGRRSKISGQVAVLEVVFKLAKVFRAEGSSNSCPHLQNQGETFDVSLCCSCSAAVQYQLLRSFGKRSSWSSNSVMQL